jgi:hypothetical protein
VDPKWYKSPNREFVKTAGRYGVQRSTDISAYSKVVMAFREIVCAHVVVAGSTSYTGCPLCR